MPGPCSVLKSGTFVEIFLWLKFGGSRKSGKTVSKEEADWPIECIYWHFGSSL